VKDEINRSFDRDELGHIVAEKPEIFLRPEVIQIPFVSCKQVVDSKNLMPLPEKAIHQMRPKEPRSTGDYRDWHILELETIFLKGKPTDSPSP